MKRFIRSSSISSINPHKLFPPNKSQNSPSNLPLLNPLLPLPQFSLFLNPKSRFILTKQNKKIFSNMSKNFSSDIYENPQILKSRTVIKKVLAQEQAEGVGAIVRRSIGRPELRNFDPFLLLDYAAFSPPAGFPDHPHRGFETVSYVLEGYLAHEDFAGHKGTIGPGDVQWMTAGRGILHSEMPVGNSINKGLQLWVNLSSKDKMIEPNYQELQSKDIKRAQKDGVDVRIIAGEAFGVRSPIYTRTPTMYLDFTMNPGSQLHQAIPEHWNAFVYTIEGEGVFGIEDSAPAPSHHTLVLSDGDGLKVWNKSEKSLRFMLIAGQPLNEPVVQYGPFVMNTRQEIEQAFEDYQLCKNGFENAKYWKRRG